METWVWAVVTVVLVLLLWYSSFGASYTDGVTGKTYSLCIGRVCPNTASAEHFESGELGYGLGMQVSGSPGLYTGRRDRPGWYDEYAPVMVYPFPYEVTPYPLLPRGDPNLN